jgi:DnaJ-class molecular chaperone
VTLVATDADLAAVRWVDRVCPRCKGSGIDPVRVDHDPEWCGDCGGPGRWATPILPTGAIQRLGHAICATRRQQRTQERKP